MEDFLANRVAGLQLTKKVTLLPGPVHSSLGLVPVATLRLKEIYIFDGFLLKDPSNISISFRRKVARFQSI